MKTIQIGFHQPACLPASDPEFSVVNVDPILTPICIAAVLVSIVLHRDVGTAVSICLDHLLGHPDAANAARISPKKKLFD